MIINQRKEQMNVYHYIIALVCCLVSMIELVLLIILLPLIVKIKDHLPTAATTNWETFFSVQYLIYDHYSIKNTIYGDKVPIKPAQNAFCQERYQSNGSLQAQPV